MQVTTDLQLLTSREAAKLLGISERTLWTLTKQGKVAAAKLGKSVRYRGEDLRRYVESCLTVPTSS
ncbi:MAG TPA: helix-turn-helix domain-containing protein [Gemmatales bacterium]|nr:helix-turn-helix domain-containing protein [Gemmatales bacterium]